ncbi:MAG: hypothetical protein U0519_02150 [Candidatus Gracilibacteria bacterium]
MYDPLFEDFDKMFRQMDEEFAQLEQSMLKNFSMGEVVPANSPVQLFQVIIQEKNAPDLPAAEHPYADRASPDFPKTESPAPDLPAQSEHPTMKKIPYEGPATENS